MSNTQSKSLDLHRAMELVKERTASRACPFCDHRKWLIETKPGDTSLTQLLGEANAAPVYLLTDADAFWEGPTTIPTIAMTCENCGFVRLHNIPVLLGGGNGD